MSIFSCVAFVCNVIYTYIQAFFNLHERPLEEDQY